MITCAACGSTGPGRRKAGLCQRCYARAWRAARPCASCGQDRPHLAAGLCARCYRLSRTRLVLCPGCGEERQVYWADRCERCKRRATARSGACRDCGKQVARLWSGRCRSCYAKSREVTGACRDCGDLTRLTSGLCKACRLFRWAHPAGTCPWCGRQQPIGKAGACRSCQLGARAARALGKRARARRPRVVLPPAARTREITGACRDCADLTWLSGGRGDIYERTEGRVSLHTRRDRVAEIVSLAKLEHPYEVPGISTRAITDGNPDYLAWITQETGPDQRPISVH